MKHGIFPNRFDLAKDVGKYIPLRVALIISGIYTILGVCWIIFSDRLLALWASEKEVYVFLSSIKGVIYVSGSALLIFFMVFNSLKALNEANNKMKANYAELENTNKRLAESENFSKAIINKMLNAYALHRILLDGNGNPCDYEFIDCNPSFEQFTGISKEVIIGRRYKEVVKNSAKEETDWVGTYGKVAITGEPISFENYTSAFDKWVVVSAYSPKKDYFITVFSDITDLKKNEAELRDKHEELTSLYEELTASEEELRQQFEELINQQNLLKMSEERLKENAYHDSLTGLPNRLALYEDFEKYMNTLYQKTMALFFVDSDNFKFINDTMGHSIGDLLIKKMGDRLTALFEGCHSTVYRLGGDEFVLFIQYDQIDEVYKYAQEIKRNFNSPLDTGENTLCITVSIGIAIYPSNGNNIHELIRNADIALYKAKESGKNCYALFSDDMHEKIMERMLIEKHLRSALANNELDVYYQPQIDAMTGIISGFEALLRWKNGELGFVPPLKFIGVAEETRLINPIGKWVLQKACTFLKKMHEIQYSHISIAVNISIIQLLQEDFVDVVEEILNSAGIAPEYLELEITESILMDSYIAISSKLNRLKRLGIKIALDDFGKGYSSLSYLRQLPIDTLKIDKCFIDSIHSDRDNVGLTGMIVKLGQNMGLTVIAEGVEGQEQMDYLIENGCHKIQGYLISKPLPENDILKFYSEWEQTHSFVI